MKTIALFALVWLCGAKLVTAQDSIHMEYVCGVGLLAGEEWQQFGAVTALGFDSAANLYVLDGQAMQVVVFARDGSHVRTFGRAGDGPGEFRRPSRMAVLRDGRTVVFDIQRDAFFVFAPDGEYQRMVRMPPAQGPILNQMPDLDPAGNELIPNGEVISTIISLSNTILASEPELSRRPVTRLVLTGEQVVTDTLTFAWKAPPAAQSSRGSIWSGPRGSSFAPKLFVGALPDGGVVFSDSSTYRLKVTDTEGNVNRDSHTRIHTRTCDRRDARARARAVTCQLRSMGTRSAQQLVRPGKVPADGVSTCVG